MLFIVSSLVLYAARKSMVRDHSFIKFVCYMSHFDPQFFFPQFPWWKQPQIVKSRAKNKKKDGEVYSRLSALAFSVANRDNNNWAVASRGSTSSFQENFNTNIFMNRSSYLKKSLLVRPSIGLSVCRYVGTWVRWSVGLWFVRSIDWSKVTSLLHIAYFSTFWTFKNIF